MARLDVEPRMLLTKEDFEQYPIWTWNDSKDGLLPTTDTEFTPGKYFDDQFVKAQLNSNGYTFDGVVQGDSSFWRFDLFAADESFAFNPNLVEWMMRDLRKLFQVLGCQPFDLFPLHYSSPIHFSDGRKIEGVFDWDLSLPTPQELSEKKKIEDEKARYVQEWLERHKHWK